MIKIITHIVKAAIAAVAALLFSSCGFNEIDGSGNVIKKTRPAQEEFTSIDVSEGIELIISTGGIRSVTVEADDNFHEHITTEIKGGELKIGSDSNFRNGTVRVIVSLPKLETVEASSSAIVRSEGTLKVDSIELSSGSGANVDVSVDAQEVTLDSGSGGHIKISGKTEDLQTESSSGGHIDAKGLAAKNVDAEASSGGHTQVNAIERLSADASSGGNITYTNTPNKLDKQTSSGGNVAQE